MSLPAFDEPANERRTVRAKRKVFDLPAARLMLPLVRRVLSDVVEQTAQMAHANLQITRIRSGNCNDRKRQEQLFDLGQEVRTLQSSLSNCIDELRGLGVILSDAALGIAGFPTIVNGSLAYLVVRHEDDDLRFWRYCDQPKLRPIPESWYLEATAPKEECEGLILA